LGDQITEFYDTNKKDLDAIYENWNTIAGNEDKMYDILQEGKDEYFDLEEQVKDAIIRKG
jgi:hypothetical protein